MHLAKSPARAAVREFIPQDTQPQRIADAISQFLTDESYAIKMRQDLSEIRKKLGQSDGKQRMPKLAMEMIGGKVRDRRDLI